MADKPAIQELDEFIIDYFQKKIDAITGNLVTMRDSKGRNRFASGMTAQSVAESNRRFLTLQRDKLMVTISMPPYYDFIDQGVKGAESTKPNTGTSPYRFTNKRPPLSAMREFMHGRQIVSSGYRKVGRGGSPFTRIGKKAKNEKSQDALAWAIGEGIRKRGIESVPFYSTVINDEMVAELTQLVATKYSDAVAKSIETKFGKKRK